MGGCAAATPCAPPAAARAKPTYPPVLTPPQGDATYLVVTNDNKLESYGINAVCTHLGCVVPWNSAENKVRAAEPGTGGRQGIEGRLGGWDGAAWGMGESVRRGLRCEA